MLQSQNIREEFMYPWPIPSGSLEPPVWDGENFIHEGKASKVFCYNKNSSNWDTSLTDIHEKEASSDHPIDIASRNMAVSSIGKYCSKTDPMVLEIGSSSGYMLNQLKSTFPKIKLIGSDFISEPLERLTTDLYNVPLIQFDLCNCPLPSDSFDVVILLNVLEHIKDDVKAIEQVARILKPGGIAHIEVPSDPNCYDLYDEFLMHFRRYEMKDLKQKILKANLEIVKATHLGVFIYPMFYLVKQYNKRFMSYSADKKMEIVSSQIRNTRKSNILNTFMNIELFLEKHINFSFGIRAVLVVKKK